MGKRVPLSDRYWTKVDRSDPAGCWPWTGATSGTPLRVDGQRADHGKITVDGRSEQAHRVGWRLAFGEIPPGMQVLHRCDNGLCQRPDHWFLGTHADNHADSSRKGRRNAPRNRGAANPRSKLTPEAVREIRRRCAAGERQVDIASDFGVRQPVVSDIHRRRKWAHVQ